MNKIGRKLFLNIACIIAFVYVLSFLANTYLLPSYFLHGKKSNMAEIMQQLDTMSASRLMADAERISYEHDVTIVYAHHYGNVDDINGTLRDKFSSRGIALSKFWITEESIDKLTSGAHVNKLYDQEKLRSRVLVSFVMKDNIVFAVADSIAHAAETIRVANQFHTWILLGALVLTLVLVAFFSQRLLGPLDQLKHATKDIANLNFRKVEIKTGDEVESLAHSVNEMSDKLRKAHQELAIRNQNLQGFISDVSHELKTPIALIKAYAAGMRDGYDDGSYLEVIEKQADDMTSMVETLLELSRLQVEAYTVAPFDMRELVAQVIDSYKFTLRQQGLELTMHDDKDKDFVVFADRAKMLTVWSNLIRNAISYTTNQRIDIALLRQGSLIHCSIKNGVDSLDANQLDFLWEPFYVVEQSRNKQLSGTGLGLSIVKTILLKHQSEFGVRTANNEIEFYFYVEGYNK
ncbi:sensor histidine kinase [Paenibacillus arenosi]|uniref:histidine kinase n=1 Tax=Paenibacillus arenosi TaxID=2774142 RepID=A0ABR9ASY4_9BACL|nr:HAMP domain-containing sensor histidine kinase [Paenibacillus arenosi]MBD8497221.1 HAMP domain-containing histidine kinase [Paenibacillus arenosi]